MMISMAKLGNKSPLRQVLAGRYRSGNVAVLKGTQFPLVNELLESMFPQLFSQDPRSVSTHMPAARKV